METLNSIISTGQGRLHLIQSAIALKQQGVNVKVITGWVPGKLFPDKAINLMGRLVGRKDLAYGLRKRSPALLTQDEVKSCSFAEFYQQFLFMGVKKKLLTRDQAAIMGWKAFSRESKKYINNSAIFHVRSGAGQAGAIKAARERGMKIVVDHSIAHPDELKQQLGKIYSESSMSRYVNLSDGFWNLVLEDCYAADVLMVNSDYVKDTFVERNYPAEKIRVIQLGIDESFQGLKQNYHTSRIRLLFTGTFGIRKGAHLIIRAAELLLKQGMEFDLDVIGNVANDLDIPDWFRQHAHIRLHGHMPQDNLKRFLAESDIYIFPTYVEGAAQSVKEAMAAGLPVVTTRNSGAPIWHKLNGFLIKDDSAEELANGIMELSNNEALRERLGRKAAETIKGEHTWSNYAKETIEMYKSLMFNV